MITSNTLKDDWFTQNIKTVDNREISALQCCQFLELPQTHLTSSGILSCTSPVVKE